METAKIDIRKLQLLNDRINQCLDALNQVRLSVHGLSHTSAQGIGGSVAAGNVLGQYGGAFGVTGQQLGAPQLQQVQTGIPGAFPFAAAIPGLSHSSAGIGVNPFAQLGGHGPMGFAQQAQPWINPYALAAYGQAQPYASPFTTPFAQPVGLSHTGAMGGSDWSAAATSADPYFLMKVVQTFPFVQLPVPPPTSLY